MINTWKNEGEGEYLPGYDGYSSYYNEPFYLSGSTLYDVYDITYYKK